MKKSILAVLMSFIVISCDGLLDTEPSTQISSDRVITTASGMDAILNSAYDRLRDSDLYSYWLIVGPEILADNSQLHPINSGRFNTQAENAFGSHFTTGVWSTSYRLINEANIIIDGSDQTETTSSHKNRLKGEALFFRGFAYQTLLKVYSYEPTHSLLSQWDRGVIMRIEPVLGLSNADFRSRGSVLEGYLQIEKDLLEALPLLQNNSRSSVYFVDQATVHAALARLYLYWGRWDDALNHAQLAENRARGSLTDYAVNPNIFNQLPNPESIFELSFDSNISSSNSLSAVMTPRSWFDTLPSKELIELYDEEDLRLNLIAYHTDGHPYMMKYNETVGPHTSHVPVFRVSEMILIQAEAHHELGNSNASIDELNRLRAHRGLGPISAGLSGQALLNEIYDERRRELAFEGHRWFDLKRRSMDVPKPRSNANSTVPFDDVRILAPLSDTQVQNNANLQQNPGY